MILFSKVIVPRGYTAITLFPFIFLKNRSQKDDFIVINHEKIHLKQQLELLVIPFYIIYVAEFIVRLIQYNNWNTAYRNISFEREAYFNETDLKYTKTRPFWGFTSYFCSNGV